MGRRIMGHNPDTQGPCPANPRGRNRGQPGRCTSRHHSAPATEHRSGGGGRPSCFAEREMANHPHPPTLPHPHPHHPRTHPPTQPHPPSTRAQSQARERAVLGCGPPAAVGRQTGQPSLDRIMGSPCSAGQQHPRRQASRQAGRQRHAAAAVAGGPHFRQLPLTYRSWRTCTCASSVCASKYVRCLRIRTYERSNV